MLELVNLSNYQTDNLIIENSAAVLQNFLNEHALDGLELMLCNPLDTTIHAKRYIKGVHLRFWPSWLDFWLGNREEVLRELHSDAAIKASFGGLRREDWLKLYQDNIKAAVAAGARYVVFHVGQARANEIFSRQFFYDSKEVILATIDVINELVHLIPDRTMLLFENLWWPGLTLTEPNLVELLLGNVRHPNTGLMLDTGHLMNTNLALRTQEAGVEYILQTIKNLGIYRDCIYGMHLHYSLSGHYVEAKLKHSTAELKSLNQIMSYILKTDQHLPFTSPAVKNLVRKIQPDYLVHEFMQNSLAEWSEKLNRQKKALGHNR